jgi:hypothetical protein
MVTKRGRPLSERAKELKRIEEMLKNPPNHIKDLPPNLFTQELLEGMEADRKALLDGYSSAIKHDLIYRLHDFLEDDPNQYPDAESVKEYQLKTEVITDGQKEGGKQTQEESKRLAELLFDKNKDLLDRLKPLGNLTVHGVATTIYKEWTTRGDGSEKPKSVKQIERYINAYLK